MVNAFARCYSYQGSTNHLVNILVDSDVISKFLSMPAVLAAVM